jgi:hypothetical protein
VAVTPASVNPDLIWLTTSYQPISFGHPYRPCAFGPTLSNVCTPSSA